MRFFPDSDGSRLREANPCHNPPGPGGGRFCSGEGEKAVDADGVTHVEGTVELYHGTSSIRANKIRSEGFRIRAVRHQTMGGDPESSRNYVWFAKKPSNAEAYAEHHQNPVIITVRLPVKLYERLKLHNSGPDSVWSPQNIPAKYVHSVRPLKPGFKETNVEAKRPKVHTEKFDRCVQQVSGKPVENAYAICQASLGRNAILPDHRRRKRYYRTRHPK